LYSILPSFVLGFHGCDESVAESVLSGEQVLSPSRNKYDWLGEGVYSWENNPTRAHEYAELLKHHPRKSGPRVVKPAVIGAIIDLGYCLNLLDAKFLKVVKDGHTALVEGFRRTRLPLPRNRRTGPGKELLLRDLDCAVINYVHQTRTDHGLRPFDTVRAAFIEGEPLYPRSGFSARNLMQICVRTSRNIKGYLIGNLARPAADRVLLPRIVLSFVLRSFSH
jgi:hypothetical protein